MIQYDKIHLHIKAELCRFKLLRNRISCNLTFEKINFSFLEYYEVDIKIRKKILKTKRGKLKLYKQGPDICCRVQLCESVTIPSHSETFLKTYTSQNCCAHLRYQSVIWAQISICDLGSEKSKDMATEKELPSHLKSLVENASSDLTETEKLGL